MDPIKTRTRKPTVEIHLVTSPDSPEFAHLARSLARSSVIALDAEWKPSSASPVAASSGSFPDVTLLQLACQLAVTPCSADSVASSPVFLLDFLSLPLDSVWNLLKDVFASPDVLKLGFRFKQDLVYLSSTFCGRGCDPGFDRVNIGSSYHSRLETIDEITKRLFFSQLEPYVDVTSVHGYLQPKRSGRKKDTKSLASICEELLGYTLSKELQCSDWSQRPLTEEQKEYAARDAHCLLEIFSIFRAKTLTGENGLRGALAEESSRTNLGLKEVLTEPDTSIPVLRTKFFEALLVMHRITSGFQVVHGTDRLSCRSTMTMDESLLHIVRKYGGKILLTESDRRPKISKKKGKRKPQVAITDKEKREIVDEWQGPPPWDFSVGGDGHPKFLCDVMVEGLAKHLRCVGIDAAIPCFKRPDARELIGQALKERRVLLTRDAKLLRHEHLIPNQICRVKSLLKNDQLLEVIETFQLQISEDQLMSRCTKCNGRFIQKPLTTEEAVEAAKGFQRIPNCLFDKNLEFWQCMDCNQLYWEGTQYHNAVQKFIDVCKLND